MVIAVVERLEPAQEPPPVLEGTKDALVLLPFAIKPTLPVLRE
jgi:hypothetical protein